MLGLIVTADDLGLTAGVNRGVLAAHERGVVTAASVMANGRALDDAVARVRDVPTLSLGAHLVLVGEDPPLLGRREIPTLVDRRGALPASWRQLSARVLAGRVDPADVRAEARAQLDRLRVDLDLELHHVNTHQHVHLLPAIARVVVGLAAEARIGFVRAPSTRRRSLQAAVIRRWRRQLVAEVAQAGLRSSDDAAGLDEAGRLRAVHLVAAVRRSGPRVRTLEVNCHPGLPALQDRARYRWGYSWEDEVRALTAAGLAEALRRAGAELVGPGDRTREEPPSAGLA